MADAELPVVDESVLQEVLDATGGDRDIVSELIDTNLADSPEQLGAITAAIDADDAATLVRPAHTLKSSSATVGAMRLSAVARELEMAGRSGLLEPSVKEHLGAVRGEWDAAREALGAWLEGASAE
jgi:HPt (histidine-containing phosphotransfer) domain-containing protein